jgi:hypothetical protein
VAINGLCPFCHAIVPRRETHCPKCGTYSGPDLPPYGKRKPLHSEPLKPGRSIASPGAEDIGRHAVRLGSCDIDEQSE